MLSAIAAMGRGRVVGLHNRMPWKLPAEMKYFRETTTGHTVIMGRRTLESMNGALKNRRNVVLTRNRSYTAENCIVVHSTEEALAAAAGEDEAFVIGGPEIYALFLPMLDKLYLTHIDHEFEGDAWFPEFDEKEWRVVSRKPGVTDERNPYRYEFVVYERVR
ncbi:dihydrofolate reductase [Paenibacillus thermoaerophilus]|uniref:Dihydrofolate reductase n=1 Tax=Paenibacillus thermoaerophilus TaxID=1215385 RepID=A0ABW2V797_9BACL|nr:dihydrofolate reductase [Paenibacillus thermoaerophilus]TMV17988.1 dihydrofolate reductase [Paenibacillus thermoaerophilus]